MRMKFTVAKIMYLIALVIFVIVALNVLTLGTIQLVPLGLAFVAAGLILA